MEKSDIVISLTEKNGKLLFSTSNRIFPIKLIGDHPGIENVRKRLDLLYPQKHEKDIVNDGVFYHVKLSIDL